MANKKRKNYGLIIEPRQPEDYLFGGHTKLGNKVLQEDGQWDNYLPLPEAQSISIETQACVSFSVLNCAEMLIKRLYNK